MEFDLDRTMRQHGGRCQTRNGFRAKIIAVHGDQIAAVVTKHGAEHAAVYDLDGHITAERDSTRDLVTLTGLPAWLARLRAVKLKL
jgi:YD repeat-containing protein